MLEGYDFVRYGLTRDLFKQASSKAVALYLLKRADLAGHDEIQTIHIEDRLGADMACLCMHDLYTVLTQAEPEAWGAYCSWCEERDEYQSRIDNAMGKSY